MRNRDKSAPRRHTDTGLVCDITERGVKEKTEETAENMFVKNLQRKMGEFRAIITVEPCMAIFLIAMSVTTIANQNLLLDKTCRVNLGHTDQLCDSLIRRDFKDNSTRL